MAEATLAEEVHEAAAANESIEEAFVELSQDVYRHRWVPSDAAADAIDGQTIRCLHREGKSNAFFYFKDEADEAAAYATPTPTEADAVDVTGQVLGFNVDLLEKIANRGGWEVRFYVMCAEGYPCAANMTAPALPDSETAAIRWMQYNSSFDCMAGGRAQRARGPS